MVEVFEASSDGVAEVAFALASDWRRQGVGSDLLVAARRWVEKYRIKTLRMVISRNNWPMRQLTHLARNWSVRQRSEFVRNPGVQLTCPSRRRDARQSCPEQLQHAERHKT